MRARNRDLSRVRSACLLAAAAAMVCAGCQGFERNPPLSGGGGTGGFGGSGSGGGGGGPEPTMSRISGRVCVLIDLTDPTVCDLIDASRYLVTDRETGVTTTTDSLGDFEMFLASTTRADLIVETNTADTEIVRALVPIPIIDDVADGVIVPVFSVQDFENLKLDLTLSSEPEAGTSTLVVHVFDGGLPAPLIDLRDPIGPSGLFYDDAQDPSGWAANGVTSDAGAVLTLGVDPSSSSVLLGRDAEVFNVASVPFAPDSMTFAEVELVE